MPAIARVRSIDTAGGVILGPGAPTVYSDFKVVSVITDRVAPHGPGEHGSPILISNGSPSVRAEFKIVAKKGTLASCGHPVIPGSSTVFVE
jgi:uncharacterized Zn-binding protein involved in type VI secretion